MNDNQARTPAGVPTGGQFAASVRAEVDVTLGAQAAPVAANVAAGNLRIGDTIRVGPDERLVTSVEPGPDPDLVMIGFDYGTGPEDVFPFGRHAVVGRIAQAPLSAEEFGAACKADGEMRLLEDPDDSVDLPDGSLVYLIRDLDDAGVVGGITESGTYLILHGDNSTVTHTFGDLGERGQVAQRIAFDAALASRASRRTEQPAEQPTADADQPDDEDVFPPGTVRPGNGRASGPDGQIYVDVPGDFWHGTEYISIYTRGQALADGVLRDHSEMAREAGIAWPVALTAAAHTDTVSWKDGNSAHQDEEGRAWDVIFMASLAIKRRAAQSDTIQAGDRIPFEMIRVPNTPRAQQPRKVTLHAVLSPDETGQPCWTISLPEES